MHPETKLHWALCRLGQTGTTDLAGGGGVSGLGSWTLGHLDTPAPKFREEKTQRICLFWRAGSGVGRDQPEHGGHCGITRRGLLWDCMGWHGGWALAQSHQLGAGAVPCLQK